MSINPGWAYVPRADGGKGIWHYVKENGGSLCRRVVYLSSMKPAKDIDRNADNCPACRKVAPHD